MEEKIVIQLKEHQITFLKLASTELKYKKMPIKCALVRALVMVTATIYLKSKGQNQSGTCEVCN